MRILRIKHYNERLAAFLFEGVSDSDKENAIAAIETYLGLTPRDRDFIDEATFHSILFPGTLALRGLYLEELASCLMEYLGSHYADIVTERYKITIEEEDSGYDLVTKAGRKRGFLMRGGEVDTERMSRILLDEYREAKLGNFTLETVEDLKE